MASTYVIRLTDKNGAELESWLGGALIIGPDGDPVAIEIASLDAITDEEFKSVIAAREHPHQPLYHHGGPTGDIANRKRQLRQRGAA